MFTIKSDYYRPIEFISSALTIEKLHITRWNYAAKPFKDARGLNLFIPNNLNINKSITQFLQFYNYKSQNEDFRNEFWILDGSHWLNFSQIDEDLKDLKLHLDSNLYIYK